MRPLRFVSPILVVVVVAFAAATYGELPGRIPMHIGLDGTPGNYQPRGPWTWFFLPAIAVAMQAMFAVLTRILPGRPELFNFPEKARFLALPVEHRAPVIREMILMLDATAIGVQGLMLLIMLQLWDAARGVRSTFNTILVPLAALLLTPVILLLVSRVSTAVRREEQKLRT